MVAYAHNQVPPPVIAPHTTARARQQRVRFTIPYVCDLLLLPEEAMDLADDLVDVAEPMTTETPS